MENKEQQLETAINELHQAILADMRAKAKVIEVAREQTKTHYDLLKVKERLSALENELSN